MQVSRSTFVYVAVALAAAAAPAFAGNYAEGDPRPKSYVSHVAKADVAAQTRQWTAVAPTIGYPEGDPRAAAQTNQMSRAQVQADAVAWVASGMSQIAYGEASMDSVGPSYKKAAQEFARMRSQGSSVASQ